MTARVLRPVMTISAVVVVLVAALAVYALLNTGATHADSTYSPRSGVKFCNDMESPFPPDTTLNGSCGGGEASGLVAGANSDITTRFQEIKGDLNFTNVVNLAPNDEVIASGDTMPAGEKMGALHSESTLGTFNGPCNLSIGVDFILFNIALPNNKTDPRASTNISFPRPQGTPNRFGEWTHPQSGVAAPGPYFAITPGDSGLNGDATLQAAYTADPVQGYPAYLLDAFDPDFNALTGADGPKTPIVPIAVYGGVTSVVATWIPLYFVQFASGALEAMTATPLTKLTAKMGQPAVSLLNDPTEAPSTSSISDFCTPLGTTSVLLGTGAPNNVCTAPNFNSPCPPWAGGNNVCGVSGTAVCTRETNPGAAATQEFFLQYDASYRDTDQDGFENAFDACPLIRNIGDGRQANAPGNGDADSDGIDDACDGVAPNPIATPNAGVTDQDGDGYQNRQDNCPQVANGAPVTFQRESELGVTAVPTFTPATTLVPTPTQPGDNGPAADSIGDVCDSGTISVNQNNNNNAGAAPAPAPALSITMSTIVGNGRYMTATNLVAKCIGTSANDPDGDGYCTANDNFQSGVCAPHCAARHNSWGGATHPALQMDTDRDKLTDVQESWMSQCTNFYAPPATPVWCVFATPVPAGTPNASFFPTPPPAGVVQAYTLGSDPTKPCAQTTTAKDEGPWDNWGFDFNDDGQVTGTDFLAFSPAFGRTVDTGLVNNVGFGQGWTPVYRYDLNDDGIVSGSDFIAFAPVYGKTCAAAGIPPFSQQ